MSVVNRGKNAIQKSNESKSFQTYSTQLNLLLSNEKIDSIVLLSNIDILFIKHFGNRLLGKPLGIIKSVLCYLRLSMMYSY